MNLKQNIAPDPLAAKPLLAGKYLTFRLDDQEFGLEIMRVQEIVGLLPITSIPRMPAHVRGVVNLRGRIVPTLDLRAKFGLPKVPDTAKTCIVVVEVTTQRGLLSLGLVVDEVAEVVRIAEANSTAVGQFAGNLSMDLVLGVGIINDGVKVLLDVEKVIDFDGLQDLHNRVTEHGASSVN